MKKTDYKWQGEKVKVKFGYCRVEENHGKPLWWYNYECYPDGDAIIPAVVVTDKMGYRFMIANHFGIGINKLLKGGWPDQTHFSFDGIFIVDGSFIEHNHPMFKEFDLDGFEEHEKKRREWQKLHYPEEYEQSEKLKQLFYKSNACGF
jgi:hypothetical protein